jgi:hypothetical protein
MNTSPLSIIRSYVYLERKEGEGWEREASPEFDRFDDVPL